MTLPRSLDDLQGLRAARWIRESTTGQFDAFGPDAQREQQDRAIERWGLADTGVSWHVAASGWRTVWKTLEWAEMLAGAGKQYDVLVVGYASRFARSLEAHVDARRSLHAAGAAVLFVDERILSSDEEAWDAWAREVVEAESYSRRLSRRIREGYAAKRRRLGEPGGRPPYGFRRGGRPPTLERIDDLAARAARAFALAAAGATDRAVAADLDLPLDTVRGILTNPIYAGRLRDGTPASVQAVVDEATWRRVQEFRAARTTRGGRPEQRRVYALAGVLECASCGRRLIGDQGRYRHRDPCQAFTAARRRRAFKHQLVRWAGHSQPAELYEGWIPLVIDGIALSARSLATAAEIYAASAPPVDELALRRVGQARDRALRRYASDRDVTVLEATMARLDAEEVRLQEPQDLQRPDWSRLAATLQSLPTLWRKAEPVERQEVARATFASVAVLGARRMEVNFRGGAQAVVMVGARGFEPTVTITRAPWLARGVA